MLVGLPKSALRREACEELFAVDGLAAGWRYRTGGERIGSDGVASQWREHRSIAGTLMVPDAGTLRVSCPGFQFAYRSPLHTATIDGEGRFAVHRGLAEVRIAPLGNQAGPPAAIDVWYELPAGEARNHRLNPADLYSVPVRGWLRRVFAADRAQPNREERIYVSPPRAVRISVGRTEIVPLAGSDAPRERYAFVLDSRTANGQLIVITRIDDGDMQDVSRFAVAMRTPADRDEVPPYGWFRPALPAPGER